jgi:hypothetical protein
MLLERRLERSWTAGFDDNQMTTVTRSYRQIGTLIRDDHIFVIE